MLAAYTSYFLCLIVISFFVVLLSFDSLKDLGLSTQGSLIFRRHISFRTYTGLSILAVSFSCIRMPLLPRILLAYSPKS